MDISGNDGATLGLNDADSVNLVLEFAGLERETSRATRRLIQTWIDALGNGPCSDDFGREYLFRSNGGEHWIPMIDARLEARRFIAGHSYHVPIRFVGGAHDEPDARWLFVETGRRVMRVR